MTASGTRTLKTLPPDGTILEEVISDMQAEYGLPATPQEYRLVIRSLPEEAKERKPARPQAREASQPEPATEQPGVSRRTRSRRRRRRRGSSATEADTEGLQDQPEEEGRS